MPLKNFLNMRSGGVLGINARNGAYIMRYNKRALYPLVDDKVKCKQKLETVNMPVPGLIAVIASQFDAAHLDRILLQQQEFAIKPVNGSGGDGIVVIEAVRNGKFRKPDGRFLSLDDLEHHISNILAGAYSLGGLPDQAMIEDLVHFDPVFEQIAYRGVPDIRVIVFKGVPVMAMVRLPTRASDGKANLHQGAVGAGIDLRTGRTLRGVWHNILVDDHPDTGARLVDFEIPYWDKILDMSAGCHEAIALGYMGVDIVLDKDRGPLILELNARPGLNIQIANQTGIGTRLKKLESLSPEEWTREERIQFAQENFGAARNLELASDGLTAE